MNQRFDKSRLPSRHVTEGPARAPHRSYFYAMGITEDEIHQPWVGVATCWNEAAPCNIALNRQAQVVKHGVKKGGGTPREFTTITVTDGIAMGHQGMKSSLVSREVIADSTELTVRGHCYDALVGLAGCDMGACAILPRIIGQGRAGELLYTGRSLGGEEGERWGFFNRLVGSEDLLAEAATLAGRIADGPSFANGITKKMLHMEWAMGVDEAIDAEALAQGMLMHTKDFARAFHAFAAKQRPEFEGN